MLAALMSAMVSMFSKSPLIDEMDESTTSPLMSGIWTAAVAGAGFQSGRGAAAAGAEELVAPPCAIPDWSALI
jgi:hypothetical protein